MTRMFVSKLAKVVAGLAFLAPVAASAQDHPIPPSTGMPVERFTTVFGQKIAYYDMSNGPVLVLVHGLSTSATIDWGQVYKPFAEKYRVIALDNIGFGDSDKPPIDYSMQTYVDFLAEFLRQLNIKHDRYLLDSGTPNRLWFLLCLLIEMNNLIQGYGIDCHGLLREAEKELAAAL